MDQISHSYRRDKNVPAFDDTCPLLVTDGVCTLCSGGSTWLIRQDKKSIFRFATAQSPLGQALLAHYGCDTVDFNTVLLVADGQAYMKFDTYIEVARRLGGWWKLCTVFGIIPKWIRDPLYDIKARNRYAWFGKTDYCALIPADLKDKFIDM